MLGQLGPAVAGNSIVAILLCVVMWGAVSEVAIWGWLFAILSLQAARVVLYFSCKKNLAKTSGNSLTCKRLFLASVLASGIANGSAGIFLFPTESTIHQIVLAMFMLGTSIGASGYAARLPTLLSFLLPTVLPVTIRTLLVNDTLHLCVGIGLLFYVGIFLRLMVPVNRAIISAIKANYELEEEIQERKSAEKEFLDSEERFKTLFNKSAEAILIIEGETFVDCNEATLMMTGHSNKQELLDTHPSELSPEFQPDGRTSFDKAREMMLTARDNGSHSFEWMHLRADGTPLPVEVLLTAIPFGETYLLHTVWRDLSDRKKVETEKKVMEEQLRQSQKMEAVGTLAGGIAHDFNNILSAVLGYTELVLTKNRLDPEDKRSLEAVLTAADRAKELVKQILMFSRKGEHDFKTLQISKVVEETVKLLRQTIPSNISINLEVDEATGTVKGNETQMHQIVMNLCTNAYQTMKQEGGQLSISLKPVEVTSRISARYPDLKKGGFALLSVQDTGKGIDPSDLQRIFDPFFTTKGVGKGTGLGLSVVHGIVKNHGGAIGVESEPGTGTRFDVFLPLAAGDCDPSDFQKEQFRGGNERILLVDDEPPLLDIGKMRLESLGYQVRAVSSAQEAIKLLQDNPTAFDLLLTDQTMPEITGDILAIEAMKLRPGFPVVICTGHSDILNDEKAHAMGVGAFLMKPLSLQDLAETIRNVLDRSS